MKSIYTYENPVELLKEAYTIAKKAQKTSAFTCQLAMLDGIEDEENIHANRVASQIIKLIEEEYPNIT